MDGLSTTVLESVHEWLLLRTVLEMLMKYWNEYTGKTVSA